MIETVRATGRREFDLAHRTRIISEVEVLDLDAGIAATAATVGPALLRSLDAIHLASAMALMPELDAFVTYDDRLAEAARNLGCRWSNRPDQGAVALVAPRSRGPLARGSEPPPAELHLATPAAGCLMRQRLNSERRTQRCHTEVGV